MKVISTIEGMQNHSDLLKSKGKSISFVPTMGALHEGHLELVRKAKEIAHYCIVSIFVNPLQFGPHEDFTKYPRPIEEDIAKCKSIGADCLFIPETEDLYPDGFSTAVTVGVVTEKFEGVSRTSHFQGVTTVVTKLLLATKPTIVLFGQKDFQQVLVLRKLIRDLNFGIQIEMVPTKRDSDGLALSSRNKYLTSEDRESALYIRKALLEGKNYIESGEKRRKIINAAMLLILRSTSAIHIDYVRSAIANTLEEPESFESGEVIVLLVASFVGKTRLIDNEIVRIP